jgi:hypothetical protein
MCGADQVNELGAEAELVGATAGIGQGNDIV